MLRATVQVTRKGDAKKQLRKLEQALRGPTKVKVGLPRGKAPGGVIQIAVWQHFGTRGGAAGGGWGGPIPARPFITIALFKHRGELRAFMRAEAKKVVFAGNPQPMRHALQNLGMKGQGIIQQQIADGVPPPLSPVTVKLKGSSQPLIDTGTLRGSITWQIDT